MESTVKRISLTERDNPFFGSEEHKKNSDQAKQFLKGGDLVMMRYDLLDAENKRVAEEKLLTKRHSSESDFDEESKLFADLEMTS